MNIIVRVEKCGVAQRVIENVKKKETKGRRRGPISNVWLYIVCDKQ